MHVLPLKVNPRGVLFDLDGTLLDTAPDLAFALNSLLAEQGREALAYPLIRPQVSHGGAALIQLGFGIDDNSPDFLPLKQRFLQIYQDNISRHTRLFEGLEDLLIQLEKRKIPWGVVTNKPAWLTDPLMRALKLDCRSAVTVSGDTLEQKKPHPAPILYACREIQQNPCDCVYIGDARRDIDAAKAAGVLAIAAAYGYIGKEDPPHTWQAEIVIEHPADLKDLLLGTDY